MKRSSWWKPARSKFPRRPSRTRWPSATSRFARSSPRSRELHAGCKPQESGGALRRRSTKRWRKKIEKKYGERLHDALDTAKIRSSKAMRGWTPSRRKSSRRFPRKTKRSASWLRAPSSACARSIFRDDMLKRRRRPDARAFDQIRKITCEVGFAAARAWLGALHPRRNAGAGDRDARHQGRQAAPRSAFRGGVFKRFMLHYNFPPFSVGEVKFLRGPGRREIGHGALAERALINLLPPEEEFPYAMRVVSDILESNGSSSMATVCGGSLALMDAGVPMKARVRGHRHGLGRGRDRLRHPHGHRRRGRSLRRHGLQSGRHARGHHGACRWISRSAA